MPTLALAQAIAAEWDAQGELLDPNAMPLTRLANSAIDGVAPRMAEVEADVVKYAGSDLICYRADGPESLVRAQAEAWDPLVAFRARKVRRAAYSVRGRDLPSAILRGAGRGRGAARARMSARARARHFGSPRYIR